MHARCSVVYDKYVYQNVYLFSMLDVVLCMTNMFTKTFICSVSFPGRCCTIVYARCWSDRRLSSESSRRQWSYRLLSKTMILRRTSVSVVLSSESDTNLSDQVITGWEVLLEGRDPHPGSLNIVGRGSTTLEHDWCSVKEVEF